MIHTGQDPVMIHPQVCIMIHTGSRGLGHQVCTDALSACDRWVALGGGGGGGSGGGGSGCAAAAASAAVLCGRLVACHMGLVAHAGIGSTL